MNQDDPQRSNTFAAFDASATPATALPAYPGIALDHVMLVRTAADAQRAYTAMRSADFLGFDTESKPIFFKGQASDGPHLIQLATDDRAYLFPVAHLAAADATGIIAVLKALLESPDIIKLGFGLSDDNRRLREKFKIEPCAVLDLSRVMRESKHREMGAKAAAAKYFGMALRKSKKISTSNWASVNLSERQIQYAADDAQVALLVYRLWLKIRAQPA
jgi:RNA polymerase sigma factor for flagellar operon FliA